MDYMNHIGKGIIYLTGFIIGVIFLEKGADKFVDATALLAKNLQIPEVYIALLTAGGEWEELIVVIIALIKGHGGIAIGNIIGSVTANILGSFSLGLFFNKKMEIDRSAKIYSCIMFAITSLVSTFFFTNFVGKSAGGILIILFIIYVASIAKGIYKGFLDAPEDSDSDSDSDNEEIEVKNKNKKTYINLLTIIISLVLTSFGGWLIIESSIYFAKLAGISETVTGLTIVSIGTTLPDKIVSIKAALKGSGGILIANTVGSNIFLITLVLGISFITGLTVIDSKILYFDILVMLGSSAIFFLIIIYGKLYKWIGIILILLYILYIISQYLN